MSRPRIAFCYRYGVLGGVSAQLLNRFPYLSRDFDVRIVYERDHGMVSRFPAGVAGVATRPEEQAAALRTLEPDVTVVIDSPLFLEAWREAGTPGRLMLEVHTTTAQRVYLRRRELLAGVSHIVTVSAYMERLLAQFGVTGLAPITVIPDCLDDRWRQPVAARQVTAQPVLWVGKLDGHKRWRTAADLVDQLSELPETDVMPMFVGGMTAPESEVRALTTKLATAKGLSRGVWWPWVEYGRMPVLYSSVGISGGLHLCTTTNESFGMAIAESIVRGCPVVAPAVGAVPELLPPAALYDPGDWAGAFDRAYHAMVDAAFREELLSTAGHVRQLTDPERVAQAYRAVVASVVDGS